jgi:hypothetical protein
MKWDRFCQLARHRAAFIFALQPPKPVHFRAAPIVRCRARRYGLVEGPVGTDPADAERLHYLNFLWSRTGPLRCFGSPLRIGLLQIDSQSAFHVGVGAGVGAVALTLGIVGPERCLRRGF